ncbi:unnamed protein product [Gongylonema pulchrum]|uniref:PH domain-containing protein n=1 Tax=Gongylonema pulchrum TaxID=637853 RepID=A0A183F103_9BILA|nr:unnamed protein product [Gongylonema pulchrum]
MEIGTGGAQKTIICFETVWYLPLFMLCVNDEVHVLETADNRTRLQWLQQLQSNRRRHYEKENVDDLLKVVSIPFTCAQ